MRDEQFADDHEQLHEPPQRNDFNLPQRQQQHTGGRPALNRTERAALQAGRGAERRPVLYWQD